MEKDCTDGVKTKGQLRIQTPSGSPAPDRFMENPPGASAIGGRVTLPPSHTPPPPCHPASPATPSAASEETAEIFVGPPHLRPAEADDAKRSQLS